MKKNQKAAKRERSETHVSRAPQTDQSPGEVPRGVRTAAGVAGGALFGFAVGGPAGAMFGGMAGLIIGASSDVGAYMDKW